MEWNDFTRRTRLGDAFWSGTAPAVPLWMQALGPHRKRPSRTGRR